jgi:DNA (cytosine-5)-methyltransferase 1
MNTDSRASLNFVSLFCGCGGFDLGFVQAGFRCAGAFDIDPLAIQVHRRNLRSCAVVRDLTKPWDLTGLPDRVDVVLAGPPCQGFSTVGKRHLNDPRNQLLLTAGKIATKMLPRVFLAENVTGVAAGEHRAYWSALREMLRSAGYRTADFRSEAHKLGVAQKRNRMLMLAWQGQDRAAISIPVLPALTLRQVITRINGAANHTTKQLPAGSDLLRIAKRIMPGQKLCNVRGGERSVHTWDIPEVFGHTTKTERRVLEALLVLRRRHRVRDHGDADPVPQAVISQQLGFPVRATLEALTGKGYVRRAGNAYDLSHTFNGKFRRLLWSEPAPTVDTRFNSPRYFLHPQENRGFTIREAARIQGFPDDFVFEGTDRQQCRLIGNAVPPPLAKHVALYIRDAILRTT